MLKSFSWYCALSFPCGLKVHSVKEMLPYDLIGCGRPEIELEKKVLVTLFMLAHEDQYRLIGDRFDMSESTTHSCVMEICEILRQNILYDYIVWPNASKQTEISDFYDALKGISGCIGCLDGTHIQLLAPTEYESDFYNRKGFHSIILQAVCDMELMFTHIDAGLCTFTCFSMITPS